VIFAEYFIRKLCREMDSMWVKEASFDPKRKEKERKGKEFLM
jgi:hypothetical protein